MSNVGEINVDICIATYKRPELLGELLKSISTQEYINLSKIRIIIIDNDRGQSAKVIVDRFFSDINIPYIYDVQPEKNIALTRNVALSYVTANYLAFIDDDEWAADDWLNNLLMASQKYDADVVFGLVMPQFPKNTPDWVRETGFFDRSNKTGVVMTHGATGNTLIRCPKKFKNTLYFDPKYGLTGGEDNDLFHRMYLNGAKLVWCNEAVAYEVIPQERTTIKWHVKRALRVGQNCAIAFLENQSRYKKIVHFIKRVGYLFIASSMFPFSLFMGKARWVWVLCKITTNAGQLSVLFTDKLYQEYK
jgi:succinoglycan biosynthesis protein ExoM